MKKLVREKLNEGRHDFNNLDDANSYYKVIEPFSVWILSGYKPTTASYNSSRIYQGDYKEAEARPGDEIKNLHGGLFFKGAASKNTWVGVKASPSSDRGPYEKGRDYDAFPLDKLERTS